MKYSGLYINSEELETLGHSYEVTMFDSLAEMERYIIDEFTKFLTSVNVNDDSFLPVDDDRNTNVISSISVSDVGGAFKIFLFPESLRYFLDDRISYYCIVGKIKDDKYLHIIGSPFHTIRHEIKRIQEWYLQNLYIMYFATICNAVKAYYSAADIRIDSENSTITISLVDK